MPLIEAAICSKTDLLSKKNVLYYKESNNEIFRRYAPYRSRDMGQKPICSLRKMPLTIHRVTTKSFGDMPLQKPRYGRKPDLLSYKNALHYTQSKNEKFPRYAPYSSRDM